MGHNNVNTWSSFHARTGCINVTATVASKYGYRSTLFLQLFFAPQTSLLSFIGTWQRLTSVGRNKRFITNVKNGKGGSTKRTSIDRSTKIEQLDTYRMPFLQRAHDEEGASPAAAVRKLLATDRSTNYSTVLCFKCHTVTNDFRR